MEINNEVYEDLLGILLVSSKDIPYITTKIKIEDIPNGVYREIYKTIVDLYNLGVEVDIVTVSNRLLEKAKLKEVGGRKAINELALNSPPPHLAKRIVESVITQTSYRKVITMIDEFKDKVSSCETLDEVCIDYCSKISNTITGKMEEDKLESISSGADEVIKDLYDSRSNGCIGIDCGFPKVNYFLGGLQKGKVYVIGARPSMGKSALAMNISEYVSAGKNVLFVSLEMSKKEYAQRLMLGRARVSVSDINTGNISEEAIARVKEQKEYLDSLNLYIETKSPCKVSDIELALINLQSTRGSCDLVVIDYLQLLTPNTKTRTRETEVSELSRDIKSLAVKYQVPIILLSQLSRALEAREDKRPMLSDLRESGSIEQDADVVMFVYRDEWYHPDNPASRGKGEILIRKNRGGMNNVDIEMCWRGSDVRFTEALDIYGR